jgi:hypothetical protein
MCGPVSNLELDRRTSPELVAQPLPRLREGEAGVNEVRRGGRHVGGFAHRDHGSTCWRVVENVQCCLMRK